MLKCLILSHLFWVSTAIAAERCNALVSAADLKSRLQGLAQLYVQTQIENGAGSASQSHQYLSQELAQISKLDPGAMAKFQELANQASEKIRKAIPTKRKTSVRNLRLIPQPTGVRIPGKSLLDPKGKFVLRKSGRDQKDTQLFDLKTGRLVHTFDKPYFHAAFHPKLNEIAFVNKQTDQVEIVNLEIFKTIKSFELRGSFKSAPIFLNDGSEIFLVGGDSLEEQTAKVYDYASQKLVRKNIKWDWKNQIFGSGQTFAQLKTSEPYVTIWNFESNEPITTVHTNFIGAQSIDGKSRIQLSVNSSTREIEMIDNISGQMIKSLDIKLPSFASSKPVFGINEKTIFVTTEEQFYIVEAATGEIKKTWPWNRFDHIISKTFHPELIVASNSTEGDFFFNFVTGEKLKIDFQTGAKIEQVQKTQFTDDGEYALFRVNHHTEYVVKMYPQLGDQP